MSDIKSTPYTRTESSKPERVVFLVQFARISVANTPYIQQFPLKSKIYSVRRRRRRRFSRKCRRNAINHSDLLVHQLQCFHAYVWRDAFLGFYPEEFNAHNPLCPGTVLNLDEYTDSVSPTRPKQSDPNFHFMQSVDKGILVYARVGTYICYVD